MQFHFFAVLLYYGSFMLIPYSGLLAYRVYKKKKVFSVDILLLLFCIVFLWGRFIEPRWLRVQEAQIDGLGFSADVVLVADIHAGVFKGRHFIERLVEKINAADAQFNIFAGDYVYEMSPEDLENVLAPLKNLNRPTYFVLGNHDGNPNIRKTLKKLGLKDIEHQTIDFGSFQLTGVGDLWKNDDQIKIPLLSKPALMVAHNPDSSLKFTEAHIKLVLSGHTHCGQVRIPYLYKVIIPTDYNLECGLEYANNATIGSLPVYITPGVGETALPLRLLNPSTIDVLHLRP